MSYSANFLSLSIIAAIALNSSPAIAQGFTGEGFSGEEYSGEEYYEEDIDESLEDFYGDEEFVSIAIGNKLLVHKAPSVATVITAKQIAHMGALTVSEVLENVPIVTPAIHSY